MKHFTLCLLVVVSSVSLYSQPKTATFEEVQSKKVRGQIVTYISSTGETFSVGDTVRLGYPFRNEHFDAIQQDGGIDVFPLTTSASGSQVKIKTMKSAGGRVWAKTTAPAAHVYGTLILNFEVALSTGELRSNQMSSDEALTELKKAKDKLDLELITEEEYNEIKEKLRQFID